MKCSYCGQVIGNHSICPFCGAKASQSFQSTSSHTGAKVQRKHLVIITSMLCMIVVLLLLLILSPVEKRTVMIYVAGSNLETDSAIVTVDLRAIHPDEIDLNTMNILLYTGGTEEWHNFIDNDDNGIYVLKKDGFQKLESIEASSMGNPDNLSYFLDYAYKNYHASKYDLILYDHGGAIDGAIYDVLFDGDNLSLEDMRHALENSPFKNKKLETVTFDSCLNGTIEVANIFKDYAKYFIASEEVSYGSPFDSILVFLNDIEAKDSGLEFGKRFIDSYENQMLSLDPSGSAVRTYSLIDLSMLDEINKEFNQLMESVDLSKSFRNLSLIRSHLYQYGLDSDSYDTVDLYSFVEQISDLTDSNKANQLLSTLSKAVKYNKTNHDESFGLSVYFPYRGRNGSIKKYLNVYKDLDFAPNYRDFIESFYKMKKSPNGYNFNVSKNIVSDDVSNQTVSMELSLEQLEYFAEGSFKIFEKDLEHPNYYHLLLSSDDVELEGNQLIANFKDQFLQVADVDDPSKLVYVPVSYYKNNKDVRMVRSIIYPLVDSDENFFRNEDYIVDLYVKNENGTPIITTSRIVSSDERIDGVLFDVEHYNDYSIPTYSYRILDENGNYTGEWERAPILELVEGEIHNSHLSNASLKKGEYYIVFELKDVYGNYSYSKFMKVGE